MKSSLPLIQIDEAIQLAQLELYGCYDYAVPQSWSDENPSERAIWIYRTRSSICGQPLTYETILRLARRKSTDPEQRQAINNSLAVLKPAKLTARDLLQLLNS